MQRASEQPETATPPPARGGGVARRLAVAVLLFVELLVIGTLGGVVLLGRLPSTPAGLFYALGLLAVLAAAVAVALPAEWAGRLSLHGALVAGAILFSLPFIWLVGTSFKYPEETFVTPPRWVPAVAHPRDRSPYLAAPAVTQDVGDDARLAVWRDAQAFLPVGQFDGLQQDQIRDAVTSELLSDLPALSDTPGGETPTVRVTRERVGEGWNKIYRAFVLGTPAVRDEVGDSFNVPPADRNFAVEGTGASLSDNGEGTLVSYDFSDRRAVAVTLTLDEKWLDATLRDNAKDPADASLAVVALPMRQDRTWHRYDVEMEHAGRRYKSEDGLYLGDYRWREVAFRPQTPRAVAEAAVGRDERNLGVFPLQPVEGEAGKAPPGTRLTLTLHKTGQVSATWAKYTQTYRDAWYSDPYWGRYLFNTIWLVALNVVGQLIACSAAAFAFSRLRWPGRDGVFILLLATMMLPAFVTMVPTFLIFRGLGWYNTLLPLWVPAFVGTPFYIFLLRQFMLGIPRELEEAARVDGCTWVGIYWRIVMPLMKPALATVAVFTFMATWNEFMGPLIYLSDERLYPLSLGLFKFRSQFATEFGMLMAASTLVTLPVVAVFFMAQRYFIEGTTLTGLKG